MSRLTIDFTVQTADTSNVVSIVPGAGIVVNARNTDGSAGSSSSVFVAASGGSTLTQPLTADSAGRIPGWLDPGDYLITVSGTGFTPYSLGYTVPGGGGGGATLGTFADYIRADAFIVVPCDGSTLFPGVLVASPPAWLDTTGQILVAGLYKIGMLVQPSSAANPATRPTTYGRFVNIHGAFTGSGAVVSLDGIFNQPDIHGANIFTGYEESQALGAGDLPYGTDGMAITVPIDATAVLAIRPYVARLAY